MVYCKHPNRGVSVREHSQRLTSATNTTISVKLLALVTMRTRFTQIATRKTYCSKDFVQSALHKLLSNCALRSVGHAGHIEKAASDKYYAQEALSSKPSAKKSTERSSDQGIERASDRQSDQAIEGPSDRATE